ncbi:MAG: heme biosynthesis protein HemY [Inquilinaceae bacterium]
MRRALFFITKLAILIAAAVWLANRPGRVVLDWQGYTVETSAGILVLAALALMVAAALAYRLLRGIFRIPKAIGRHRAGSRREQGYRALTQGMVAVAAGDAAEAARYSRKADTLLNEPPLTMLLSAQAAQLNGDEAAARRYFDAMLKRRETEFLGVRGLLTQALKRNDRVEALALADRARTLKPHTPWVLTTSLDLQVQARKWTEALATLNRMTTDRLIDPAEARRHKTAILIERSRELEAAGDPAEAQRAAHGAVNLSPDFAPAVLREAALLARAGRDRQAARLIEKSWGRAPHRELAEAFAALGPDGEAKLARVKRLEKLHKAHPDEPEGLIALSEAELDAELWGAARSHLMRAELKQPSRRVYRLLARLETAEKNDQDAARSWLAKADATELDPVWVCRNCGIAATVWGALCENCHAFDSLEWRRPTSAVPLPAPPDRAPGILLAPAGATPAAPAAPPPPPAASAFAPP